MKNVVNTNMLVLAAALARSLLQRRRLKNQAAYPANTALCLQVEGRVPATFSPRSADTRAPDLRN
jgi:hypothetical protein